MQVSNYNRRAAIVRWCKSVLMHGPFGINTQELLKEERKCFI